MRTTNRISFPSEVVKVAKETSQSHTLATYGCYHSKVARIHERLNSKLMSLFRTSYVYRLSLVVALAQPQSLADKLTDDNHLPLSFIEECSKPTARCTTAFTDTAHHNHPSTTTIKPCVHKCVHKTGTGPALEQQKDHWLDEWCDISQKEI